jgi:hypothetical protein
MLEQFQAKCPLAYCLHGPHCCHPQSGHERLAAHWHCQVQPLLFLMWAAVVEAGVAA